MLYVKVSIPKLLDNLWGAKGIRLSFGVGGRIFYAIINDWTAPARRYNIDWGNQE